MLKRPPQPDSPPPDGPRKAVRTVAPILLRFVGCAGCDEPIAVNGEFFTLGDGPDDTVPLPAPMRRGATTKLRFTRGVEGWRVGAAENRLFFVNQRSCRGPSDLASGDVVRLEPGGAGVQFLVRSQPEAARGARPPKVEASAATLQGHVAEPLGLLRLGAWKPLLVAAAVIAALVGAYLAGQATQPLPANAPADAPSSDPP